MVQSLSDSQRERFKNAIASFANDSIDALQEDDKAKSCKIWYKHFGDRFPSCDGLSKKAEAITTAAPAILRDNARSAV